MPPRLPHWKAGAPGCCLTLSATAPPHVALPMPWGKIQVLCLALTYNSAPACSPGLTSHHVVPCGAFPSATLHSSAGNTPLPGTHCSAFKTQLQRRLLWKPFPTSATPSPAPLQGRVTTCRTHHTVQSTRVPTLVAVSGTQLLEDEDSLFSRLYHSPPHCHSMPIIGLAL